MIFGKIRKVNRLFVVVVLLPTLISVVYFGLVASDIYISESRFIVRSAQKQTLQGGVLGSLLEGTSFSRSTDDTYPVIDYIESRDALNILNENNYMRDAYGAQKGDRFNSFPGFGARDGFEYFWKYYNDNVVSVSLDSASGIIALKVRAFTAKDAAYINGKLINMSENLINKMNLRAAQDSIAFSQQQVSEAADRAKQAAIALAQFRNSNTIYDPDKQSALQLQQVATLQTRLLAAQTQLAQIELVSPKNPQIPALKETAESTRQQIKEATSDVSGGRASLSNKSVQYTKLQLDAQFADKELGSAMSSLENARADAQRKQLYLEKIASPSTPDEATEPRRLRSIVATFLLGLIAWGILTILLAGVLEHKD